MIKRHWKDGRRISYAIKYCLADGTQKFETIGPSKKEAERVLSRGLDEINRGAYRDVVDISFAEFADKWMAEYVRPRLKPSTIVGYESQLRSRLVPEFGPLRLSAITAASIHAWIGTLTERGLSPASVNHALAQLKFMLSHAVDSNHLGANPAKSPAPEGPLQGNEGLAAGADSALPGRRRSALSPLLRDRSSHRGPTRRDPRAPMAGRELEGQPSTRRWNYYKGQLLPPKSRTSVRRIDLAPSLLEALRKAKPSGVDGESHIFLSARSLPLDPATIQSEGLRPGMRAGGRPPNPVPRPATHLRGAARRSGAPPEVHSGANGTLLDRNRSLDLYGHLLPDVHQGRRRSPRTNRFRLPGIPTRARDPPSRTGLSPPRRVN